MKENEMGMSVIACASRPWWSVRAALLAALTVLVSLLVALLARPELLDRGFTLAGL
jgi:hypothetical protein